MDPLKMVSLVLGFFTFIIFVMAFDKYNEEINNSKEKGRNFFILGIFFLFITLIVTYFYLKNQ